jgi:lipoic acid synthetase
VALVTMPAPELDPGGRKLLRLEVRNSATPIERKPPWIRIRATMGPSFRELKSLVRRERLHTVCEAAGCPNIYECWEDREATFLIGGDQCTRRCDFCQIDTGRPALLDPDEPRRVAESVQAMGLRYSTVTGVARDDLPDGGAWLYAETVRQIHALNPGTGVELLIPDFTGRPEQLREVFDAAPEVLAHNLETVPRIFKRIRPAFTYPRSLDVLRAWVLVKRPMRSPLRWPTCMQRGASCSRSPSISGPRLGTTQWRAGSRRRSSSSMPTPPS